MTNRVTLTDSSASVGVFSFLKIMNMNVKELRIGNLVTIDNPKAWAELKNIPMTVTDIKTECKTDYFTNSDSILSVSCIYKDHNYWVKYSQFNEFISPIHLTEEWLIKFGFDKRITIDSDFYDINYVPVLDSEWKLIGEDYLFSKNNDDIKTLKYVHELQNLYFALTGEELTLN